MSFTEGFKEGFLVFISMFRDMLSGDHEFLGVICGIMCFILMFFIIIVLIIMVLT